MEREQREQRRREGRGAAVPETRGGGGTGPGPRGSAPWRAPRLWLGGRDTGGYDGDMGGEHGAGDTVVPGSGRARVSRWDPSGPGSRQGSSIPGLSPAKGIGVRAVPERGSSPTRGVGGRKQRPGSGFRCRQPQQTAHPAGVAPRRPHCFLHATRVALERSQPTPVCLLPGHPISRKVGALEPSPLIPPTGAGSVLPPPSFPTKPKGGGRTGEVGGHTPV